MRTSTQSASKPGSELGALLRHWRDARRRSQFDLSIDTGVSQRHISFIESGRSAPGRQTLLDIAQALDVPLRDRNTLLLAAGFAPLYSEGGWNTQEMQGINRALERMLRQPLIKRARLLDVTVGVTGNLLRRLLHDAVRGQQLRRPQVGLERSFRFVTAGLGVARSRARDIPLAITCCDSVRQRYGSDRLRIGPFDSQAAKSRPACWPICSKIRHPRAHSHNCSWVPETADDAAVYRLNDTQAIVATTDFFMPIVDDPFDFGRIAATNALSDVYAMGGTPILALAIVGMPIKVLAPEVIREILRGGESVCAQAEIPLAGGHSIDSVEPIYGLVALGTVHPDQVKRNSAARAGDVLVLGKPLGVGILSAALKEEQLDPAGYRAMIDLTTRLNRAGPDLAKVPGVHAMTDVTGFGLLGHLLEMCRGAQLTADVRMSSVPLLDNVLALAERGFVTGASGRNWASYGTSVQLAPGVTSSQQALLCDPQTSGGLLVACAEEGVREVMTTFERHGFEGAAVIGTMASGAPEVSVSP